MSLAASWRRAGELVVDPVADRCIVSVVIRAPLMSRSDGRRCEGWGWPQSRSAGGHQPRSPPGVPVSGISPTRRGLGRSVGPRSAFEDGLDLRRVLALVA